MRLPAVVLLLWVAAFRPAGLWAGGSGLNVIVVVNQNSAASLQLGNEYCRKRAVPPQNVFRMTGWTGDAVSWSRDEFEARLRNPLLDMIQSRGLANQATYVLLSMDVPYRVTDGASGSFNSTTSALFYGFKIDTSSPLPCLPLSCSLPEDSHNSYVFSEMPFREAPPDTASTNGFLAMMLTDHTLAGARRILSRGVASDGTFPTEPVFLARTTDLIRSGRFVEFDNVIFDTRIRGDDSLVRVNTNDASFTNSLGLLTGLAQLSFRDDAFLPGAMGDSLTSFAGYLFDPQGQTTLLAFLEAGAAGSYGTICEPCAYLQKFPNAMMYFYQKRGFCLAEAYYQSIWSPYQGLLVGEPLSAPFARPGTADWSSLPHGTVLNGQARLSPTFSAAATHLPLNRVDLFVDGHYVETVTNVPPAAGNVVSAIVNGFTVSYTVPDNATEASVAAGLASAMNAQTESTRVLAYVAGDRLELQSLDLMKSGSNVVLSASVAAGSAGQTTLWATPARSTFLDSAATGYLTVYASNAPVLGDWLQLRFGKTDGTAVVVGVTNTESGTSLATLLENLQKLVNATPALQGEDGVLATDFIDETNPGCDLVAAEFTLYARSSGWAASRIEVSFAGSTHLPVLPSGTNVLQSNLTDLRPRNHLGLSSGATALAPGFVLDTTRFPDGFHELTAVAYEGTSVRTQTRVSREVQIRNTSLAATLTPLLAGTNATIDMSLQFEVNAASAGVAHIELYSTGGLVGVISNQPVAVFTVPLNGLGVGVHPFHALVTDHNGNRYQTARKWIRVIPSFALRLSGSPLSLFWEAIPGAVYGILAAKDPGGVFEPVDSIVAGTTRAQWQVPAPLDSASFYRVSLKDVPFSQAATDATLDGDGWWR